MNFLNNLQYEFFLSRRFFKSRRGFISFNAFFSIFGIMLGVASLIVVMAIMNGFRKEITTKFIAGSGDIAITKFGNQQIDLPNEIFHKIEQNQSVSHIVLLNKGQGLATTRFSSNAVEIRGVKKIDLLKKEIIQSNVSQGKLDDFGQGGIVCGEALAAQIGAHVGDFIEVITPNLNRSFFGDIPRAKKYQIKAIFNSGAFSLDSAVIFMEFADAAKLLNVSGNLGNFIEINLQDSDFAPEIASKIRSMILNDGQFSEFMVRDWQSANLQIFNALKTERVAMFSILSLIIIVAAFNIVSSLIMLVNSKKKNIAILRVFGLSRAQILRIFIICGMQIGILGTFFGVALGALISVNIDHIKNFLEGVIGTNLFDPVIYYLSYLPAKLEIENVLNVAAMAIILSFLATIYPSFKAANLSIAKIFRQGE